MQNCYQIGVLNDFTFELLISDALLGVKDPQLPELHTEENKIFT